MWVTHLMKLLEKFSNLWSQSYPAFVNLCGWQESWRCVNGCFGVIKFEHWILQERSTIQKLVSGHSQFATFYQLLDLTITTLCWFIVLWISMLQFAILTVIHLFPNSQDATVIICWFYLWWPYAKRTTTDLYHTESKIRET